MTSCFFVGIRTNQEVTSAAELRCYSLAESQIILNGIALAFGYLQEKGHRKVVFSIAIVSVSPSVEWPDDVLPEWSLTKRDH